MFYFFITLTYANAGEIVYFWGIVFRSINLISAKLHDFLIFHSSYSDGFTFLLGLKGENCVCNI